MNFIRRALVQCLLVAFALSVIECRAGLDRNQFSGGAALQFSSSLTSNVQKTFGSGWKMATYSNVKGEKFNLFQMEALTSSGGIFGNFYPIVVSPTGKYVVVDVLRVGIVNPGLHGAPEVQNRQYCPVLETRTGCILSNQAGELCAGEWGRQGDRWTVHGLAEDANTPMLRYQFEDAGTLWKEYENSKSKPFHIYICEAISGNLGVANLMACDPPGAGNVA